MSDTPLADAILAALRARGPTDSRNNPVRVGDRVRWRGETYTIAGFVPGAGIHGTHAVEFVEPRHLDEVPDEVSIDLIRE